MTAQPKIVPAGDGPNWAVFHQTVRGLMLATDTGGRLAVTEVTVPPGDGPPPHVHDREDELFYILDGELEVCSDGVWATVSAGGTVFLPRGVPHTFRNATDRPCRFLVVITPGGFEGFFRESSDLAERGAFGPEVAAERAASYGVEFLAG